MLARPVGPFGLGAENKQKSGESEKLQLLLQQTTLCSFSLTGVYSRFMGKRVIPMTGPTCFQSLDPFDTDSNSIVLGLTAVPVRDSCRVSLLEQLLMLLT